MRCFKSNLRLHRTLISVVRWQRSINITRSEIFGKITPSVRDMPRQESPAKIRISPSVPGSAGATEPPNSMALSRKAWEGPTEPAEMSLFHVVSGVKRRRDLMRTSWRAITAASVKKSDVSSPCQWHSDVAADPVVCAKRPAFASRWGGDAENAGILMRRGRQAMPPIQGKMEYA